jgi:hypothetical protein
VNVSGIWARRRLRYRLTFILAGLLTSRLAQRYSGGRWLSDRLLRTRALDRAYRAQYRGRGRLAPGSLLRPGNADRHARTLPCT